MKKSILIALTVLLGVFALPARAEPGPLTLLLAGGDGNDSFHIALSTDGRQYLIRSGRALETGGDLCVHPEERPNELSCQAPPISGFEVNAGGGTDFVNFGSDIPVPVTVRGGSDDDFVSGGSSSDKVLGGAGNDVLVGRRGNDWILGGPGRDRLRGGSGDDQLRGGPGKDKLNGGPGQNQLIP